MSLNLNRTPNEIDRLAREGINENWTKIENSYNNVVNNISEEAFDKIVDSAKLIWKEPVNTFNDLSTTYPNAEEGWASMARDTGIVYRYDASGNWKPVQQITVGPVNEVDERLTSRIVRITGSGVLEGLLVEPQTWPIRDMTVQVSAGIALTPNGKYYEIPATPVINIDPSDPVLTRKDVVYVSNAGVVTLLKGTSGMGDVPPPVIPDGIILGIITLLPGKDVIDTLVVMDNRRMLLSNDEIVTDLQNAKESNALSVRYSDGTVTRMFNNAQTYVKNSNRFAYGTPTAFAPGPIYVNGDGKFLMNCSSFGYLVTQGIPFENSKYGGLSENFNDPKFSKLVPDDDDTFTYDWAKWAYDNGFGFTPNEAFDNLVPGDVIFFSWKSPSMQLPKHNASFMNLDHTAILVEVNPDGSFVAYEDGYIPAMTTYTPEYREQVKYVCRLPFENVALDIENIAMDSGTKIISLGRTVVNTYRLSENLKNDKWYTVKIKADIQTLGCWFNVYSGSSLLYSGRLHGIVEDGFYTFHFCTKNLTLTNTITLSLVANSESDVPSNTRNCEVDWFVLTEGFTNAIDDYVPGQLSNPTFTFTNGFTGIYNTYRENGLLNLNVRITNPGTMAVGSLVDVGLINGIRLRSVINIAGTALQELNALPSYSNDVVAFVSAVDTSVPPYRLRVKNGTTDSSTVSTLSISCVLPIE